MKLSDAACLQARALIASRLGLNFLESRQAEYVLSPERIVGTIRSLVTRS